MFFYELLNLGFFSGGVGGGGGGLVGEVYSVFYYFN